MSGIGLDLLEIDRLKRALGAEPAISLTHTSRTAGAVAVMR